MNSFFKTFWAALLAFVVANILIGLFTLAVWSGVVASFSKPVAAVSQGSVLVLDFAENITDSPQPMTIAASSLTSGTFEMTSNISILQAVTAIDSAAADSRISGIYINYTGAGNIGGTAHIEELRAAIARFRSSGKFVVGYNAAYSQGLYWLSSVADKVFVNPEGAVEWKGLASQVMFYKNLIDRLGLDVQIIRHGTYKSAVEPYITTEMSRANRIQTGALVGSIWGTLVEDVAASRNLSVDALNECANNLAAVMPADAKRLGLVDSLLYENEVVDYLKELSGCITDELPTVTLGDYIASATPAGKRISHNKIAIVYADGQIIDGESTMDGSIGDQTIAGLLADARKDKGIKAVVFRVNSPGGSALASEVIWHEVTLLRQTKPVIVSMANYAASGGYYISAPSDEILADRTTITGSIGVFGMMLNAQKTLNNKLGINVDVVKTSPSADMGTIFRPLTKSEIATLQQNVENTYSTFVDHVAEGRNLTFDEVDAIGQGRVWSGVDASTIGLVDGFGGIIEAISWAVDRAGVGDDFRITELLPEEDEWLALFNKLFSARLRQSLVSSAVLGNELGESLKLYNEVMQMASGNSIQARMPYNIVLF
ncbi:MAG: signal peptide peptidase SppA [Tidjanibacter sp.]|nr:signal peptide peptidase SppA [Tidjanibacter sp.]